MGLVFDLSDEREIRIDQDHEVFDGAYDDAEFEVVASPIGNVRLAEIKKKHTRVARGAAQTDEDAVDRDVFVRQVKSWSGIEIKGRGALECTRENRELIADRQWAFAKRVVAAIIGEQAKAEKQEAAELGN